MEIELLRSSEVTLARQIYQALQTQMIEGRLKPGEVLTSTREMAKHLGISRNTVCEAYEMLAAEGFITSRPGSKTRVADGLHLEQPLPGTLPSTKAIRTEHAYLADFRTGHPDLREFPRYIWLQLLRKSAEEIPIGQWGYTGPEGFSVLRAEIASWLFRSRGLAVNAQDVFITAGATQALHLIANLLSANRKKILIEDPCHIGMLRVLQGNDNLIEAVPVDKHGLQPEYLDGNCACAVYVTPSHQFPLGGILPAYRRTELIRFARKHDLYIIEDDYDSEFRYNGPPIAPLHAMDSECVIYVGTFSKIMFPALRVGYVVLPCQLHAQWRHLRTYADVQNPLFEQAALAEYLRSRKLDRHVQRMRKLYGQRRQVLLQALTEKFDTRWAPWGDAAGLHIALEFPDIRFDKEFILYSKKSGVNITSIEYHSIQKGTHINKVLLGYGHLNTEEIHKSVNLFHNLISSVYK